MINKLSWVGVVVVGKEVIIRSWDFAWKLTTYAKIRRAVPGQ